MFQYEWLKVCLSNEMKLLFVYLLLTVIANVLHIHVHMEQFEEQAVMASAHNKLGS